MIRFIDYLTVNKAIVRFVLYGLSAAIVIWSLTVDTSHAHTWVEQNIPGFWSIFGLVSAVVLIFVARWYARSGIEREEDYYDNE